MTNIILPVRTGTSSLPRSIRHKAAVRQKRWIASTSRRQAARIPRQELGRLAPKQSPMSSRMKDMKLDQIPDDLGLFPNTLVRPTFREGPSLFSRDWRKRLTIEWCFAKQTFQDYFQKLTFKLNPSKDPVTGEKLKRRFDLKYRYEEALRLQRTLYDAIAAHDRRQIQKWACGGLAQQQSARADRTQLEGRPAEWWNVQHGRLPPRNVILQFLFFWKPVQIVADREVMIPVGDTKVRYRQFIARIKSIQERDRHDGTGVVRKNITEYFVIQKRWLDKELEGARGQKPKQSFDDGSTSITAAEDLDDVRTKWKVWGTVKASTYEEAQQILDPKFNPESGRFSGGFMANLRNTLGI